MFHVIEQRKGTKKSCRGIEKVREAGRSKKKPFLFEKMTRKTQAPIKQQYYATPLTSAKAELSLTVFAEQSTNNLSNRQMSRKTAYACSARSH